MQPNCLVHEYLDDLLDLVSKHKTTTHKSEDRLDRVILMMNMSHEIMIEALFSTFMIDICDDNMIEAPI